MITELHRAVRSLRRDLGATALAVATLAVAIAACTAIASVVDAILIEPLPFDEPGMLFRIGATNPQAGDPETGVSYPDLLDLERGDDAFDAIAGYYSYAAVLTSEAVPRHLTVSYTSLNFFAVLGSDALLGRPYDADPEGGLAPAAPAINPAAVAVISEGLWRRAFGVDPEIVGRAVTVDGELRRVVAVMGELGVPSADTDMWLPWRLPAQSRNDRFLGAIGRLGAGSDPAPAEAGLRGVAAGLAERFPDTNAGWSVGLYPLSEVLVGEVERPLWFLSIAALLVLAVASVNVAGLMLSRNWRRSTEVAVRRALGASGVSIARTLMAESLLVTGTAAVLGVATGRMALRLLPLLRLDLPLRSGLQADSGALVVSVGLAVAAGLSAGLASALGVLRTDPAAGLKSGARVGAGRQQLRARSVLIAVQGAIVTMLLVGAALLLQSFLRLTEVPVGFEPHNVVVGRVELEPGVAGSAGSRVTFFDNLLDDLRSRPEVVAAGATTVLPLTTGGTDFNRPFWRAGEANPGGTAPQADIRMVSPGYFRALGIPLLSGRDFDDGDRFDGADFRAGRRVAIVNRSLVEQTWPGADGAGERLMMDYPRQVYEYEVVGVVDDARYYGPRTAPRPEVYIPYGQNPYPGMSVVVQVREAPARMIDELPQIVAELNPSQPIHDVRAADELVAASMTRDRAVALLLAGFAAITLGVAACGVYGLTSSNVAVRARELGIRLAIGAHGVDLVRQMLGETLRIAAWGVASGVVLASIAGRLLADILYGTDPTDLRLHGLVAMFMLVVVAVAGFAPAWRTTRLSPSRVLRRRC